MCFQLMWDQIHTKYLANKVICDDWLDQYLDKLLTINTPILDLGCGLGNDTLYLVQKGLNVIACDFSQVALDTIRKNNPKVETRNVDITRRLPFANNSFDAIIADLSLHYFDEKTTYEIMYEIKRILTSNGVLIARVNSTADINHGAGQGKEIENNFYFVEGYNKRFFTLEEVDRFFSIIGNVSTKRNTMSRYSKPKEVIEVCVQK